MLPSCSEATATPWRSLVNFHWKSLPGFVSLLRTKRARSAELTSSARVMVSQVIS